MIKAAIYRDSKQRYKGFAISGHAGYAESGRDIVCAAVSALAINTVNSIEKFTEDDIRAEEKNGLLKVKFTGNLSKESILLMDAMLLGLQGVEDGNKKYLKIIFKEV